MKHRTIKAYSKATHTISQPMMHGNIYTHDEGCQEVLYIMTDESDEQIVNKAKAECEKLGIELWKVCELGSKPTSFNTYATWCENELYLDSNRASYYRGVFNEEGVKID